MKIKVRYFTTLRELSGTREEVLEMKSGSSLTELIDKVAVKYGGDAFSYMHDYESGEIHDSLIFLINGIPTRNLQGFETKLKEGDVVAIIPPIGGG